MEKIVKITNINKKKVFLKVLHIIKNKNKNKNEIKNKKVINNIKINKNFGKRQEDFIKKKNENLNKLKSNLSEKKKLFLKEEEKELTFKPKINSNKRRSVNDLLDWKITKDIKNVMKIKEKNEKIDNILLKTSSNKKININDFNNRIALWNIKIIEKKNNLKNECLKGFFKPKINKNSNKENNSKCDLKNNKNISSSNKNILNKINNNNLHPNDFLKNLIN